MILKTDQNKDPQSDQPVAYDPTPGSNWSMNIVWMYKEWFIIDN